MKVALYVSAFITVAMGMGVMIAHAVNASQTMQMFLNLLHN